MARITALSFIMPVRDLDAAAAFYCKAFELEVVYRADRIVFVGMPGAETAVGLLLDPERAGSGPQNVGMHVDHAVPLDQTVADVQAAGGRLVERGQHAPDVHFARVTDPDGNEFWV